jgi:glycosyltransferase involved in cell wall biosynthesis
MNLLFIVHNWPGYSPHGGTELHTKSIVEVFKKYTSDNIYVLFPDGKGQPFINTYVFFNAQTGTYTQYFLNYPVSRECYGHEEYSNFVTKFIIKQEIDIVHFFHIIGNPLSLPLVAQQAGPKVVITFMDYYYVCPHPNLLLDGHHTFCGYPNVSLETCDLCLKRVFQYEYDTQRQRRQLISEILSYADGLHFLCEDQKSRILSAYPHIQNHPSITIGIGLDRLPVLDNTECFSLEEKPLEIACIGNFISNKGADLLLEIIEYYKPFDKVKFHIFGSAGKEYQKQLLQLQESGVRLYNGYSPETLPQLLKGYEVALFASTWPETFVLALSEAWASGLVPVAPNLGALGERITHTKNGFLYDPNDPGSLIQILSNLADNREQLNNCLDEISNIKYPTLKDNLDAYLKLYRNISNCLTDKDTNNKASRVVLSARPQAWAKSVVPLPPGFEKLPVVSKNIVHKFLKYYHKQGVAKTILKSFDYIVKKLKK